MDHALDEHRPQLLAEPAAAQRAFTWSGDGDPQPLTSSTRSAA